MKNLKEAAKSRNERRSQQSVDSQLKSEKVKDTSTDPTVPIVAQQNEKKENTGILSAQSSDAPTVSTVNTPATKNTLKSTLPVKPGVLTSIIEMQEAIIAFGKSAANVDAFSMAPKGTTGTEYSQTGEYLGGHDAISQFLFSNYMSSQKDKSGKTFVATEGLDTKTRMDTSVSKQDLNSLRGWVNTIQMIGRDDQKKPDGIWGPRTNNALSAIANFSKMILGFSKDMGVEVKSAQTKDVDELVSKIPSLETGSFQNGDVAKTITPIIKKLNTMINEFKSSIMENKDLKDYLSQTKPLLSVPSKNIELSDQDNTTMNQYSSVQFDLGEFKGITLKDLSSLENFSSFLKKMKIETSSFQELINLINKLKNNLQNNLKNLATSTRT